MTSFFTKQIIYKAFIIEKGNNAFIIISCYKAADLNQPDAQWKIAMMLEKSMISGIQDLSSAECFYLASASHNHPIGLYHYARFEEIYNNKNCYSIYKIAANLGLLDAEIPIIASDISQKDLTEKEIYDIVDSKDSSISTELLFRIAYSLPKNKEELAEKIRVKAKSQLKNGDIEKFYGGFGLSSVFKCLREMTENSLNWDSITKYGENKISPTNKILCWSQDFPNSTIDTVKLQSEEVLIKLPKDAMIIRNKYTKLSKKDEYQNDPFFLFLYMLHIQNHHEKVDPRLKQFIDATKEKLRSMNYKPYFDMYEPNEIENENRNKCTKEYILDLEAKCLKKVREKEEAIRKKRMRGEFTNESVSISDEPRSDKKEVLRLMKLYPQFLYDLPCKFFKLSQFYNKDYLAKSTYQLILNAAFPSTKYWINEHEKAKNVKNIVVETIIDNDKYKIESTVNIISSELGTMCTYYNADHIKNLEDINLNHQFDGIMYTKDYRFDGRNLIQQYDIKEIKTINPDQSSSPLEKSLLLAEILKQLFSMQVIGSKHGNITKDSFIIADGKIMIFGCDIYELFDYLNPETDFQNAKDAIQEIIKDVPEEIINLFNDKNDFVTVYQTIMLDPEKYLYKNTPIDSFLDNHVPFQYKEFISEVVYLRKNTDYLLKCTTMPGQDYLIISDDYYNSSIIQNTLLLSFLKDSDYILFQLTYNSLYDSIKEQIQLVGESNLTDVELGYYTYLKRKGVFYEQENIEYKDNLYGNRMKLIERIEDLEKEAISDYHEQKLKQMSFNVKKLIHVGNENVVNLYGILFKYGIFSPKDKEKAQYYLSCEKVPIPCYQFAKNSICYDYQRYFLTEYNFTKYDLYGIYEHISDQVKCMEIPTEIAKIRCKRKVTNSDIEKLLSIQEMPYKIEAMFTAGILLRSTDLPKSKTIRSEAMKLYLETEWHKYSDAFIFFCGLGFSEPILEYFKEFQMTAWDDVNLRWFYLTAVTAIFYKAGSR